jgi:uncharacterized membrane protein
VKNQFSSKTLVIVGIVLMAVGGGLAIKGYFTEKDRHEAEILGAEISVTTTEKKEIPLWVSGTAFGVGAILTVTGALRGRDR